MSRPSSIIRLGAVVALIGAAACSDRPTLTDATQPPALQPAHMPDFAAIARDVPGFGGYFVDDGVPTVYLTDPAQAGAAARALGLAASAVRVIPGRYDYGQLNGWFERVSYEGFEIPGMVFVDLDEAHNTLLVGVEHRAAAASARGLAARLGVPAAAITVREVEPIQRAATLRDRVRPTVGGLQIHWNNFLCTLGFNAVDAGQNSFITNSHCSGQQGGVQGTIYFQPTSTVDGVSIATEVEDPTYFRNQQGCPRGRKCRFSDASRAAYAAGATFDIGGIAAVGGTGSITITGTQNITGTGTAAVGNTVSKVGRTTGLTTGSVTNTCVNTGVSGTNIVQLCQTFVSAGVGGGDSGSPVYTGSGSVTLVGILWGGNSSGTQFVYSPFNQIQQELGTLVVN